MKDLEKFKEAIVSSILSDGSCTLDYDYVAEFFPGAPHPLSFEKRLIDNEDLLKWSIAQGFRINIDNYNEYLSFENMPCITFIKK